MGFARHMKEDLEHITAGEGQPDVLELLGAISFAKFGGREEK